MCSSRQPSAVSSLNPWTEIAPGGGGVADDVLDGRIVAARDCGDSVRSST
jgi:hypothetical protein